MRSFTFLAACALALLAGCASPCGPSNCNGCCGVDGACHASSDQACGAQGSACQTCAGAQHCSPVLGQCIFENGTGGAGGNGGSSTTTSTSSTTSSSSSSGSSSTSTTSSGSTGGSTSSSTTSSASSNSSGSTGTTSSSSSTSSSTTSSGSTSSGSTSGGSTQSYIRVADFADSSGLSVDYCYHAVGSGTEYGPVLASYGQSGGISQGQITGYMLMDDASGGSGQDYVIDVVTAGSSSCSPVLSWTITVYGGRYQTYVVAGSVTSPTTLSFFDDTAPANGDAAIRLIHASQTNGAPTGNVDLNGAGLRLLTNIGYLQASTADVVGNGPGVDAQGYLPWTHGSTTFTVDATGTSSVLASNAASLAQGAAVTGFFTAGTQLMICPDDGTHLSAGNVFLSCQ